MKRAKRRTSNLAGHVRRELVRQVAALVRGVLALCSEGGDCVNVEHQKVVNRVSQREMKIAQNKRGQMRANRD